MPESKKRVSVRKNKALQVAMQIADKQDERRQAQIKLQADRMENMKRIIIGLASEVHDWEMASPNLPVVRPIDKIIGDATETVMKNTEWSPPTQEGSDPARRTSGPMG